MLFNSYSFILLFLPAVVAGFFLLGRYSNAAGCMWLGAASLFFYGFWEWSNTFLLIGSILFNYFCGRWLSSLVAKGGEGRVKMVLAGAIAANLTCLAYY